MLDVNGLDFAWPQGPAWRGWSTQVQPGVTALVGGDGVGKTTLLRLLAAELRPTGGQLALNGTPAWGAGGPASAANPAYTAQVFWCDPASNALDELTAHAYLAQHAARHAGWQAEALADHLAGFALLPHLEKRLYALSMGMRRKLRWAAGFASGAALTLLDDPFAALDRASIDHVLDTLDELADHPHCAVVVAGYEPPPGVTLAGRLDLG
ncbi:MAG: ATP-binding cassette domain-containing protein [Burkholderiaceae bacterium]